MTAELFNAIKFRFISHASYSDEHISVYESTNFAPTITIKVFTKRKGLCEVGKSRIFYYFNGKSYRSEDSLLSAINKCLKTSKKEYKQKSSCDYE